MTSTMTTQERIYDLLRSDNHAGASQSIAAEIDALTQTNALMLDSAERGQATVAELRAEVATLTAELLQKEQQLAAARAERDECARSWAMSQQQLAEARDTIAANNAKSEAWEAEAEAQLAEARAEVERLWVSARALELLRGEGWTVADYVAQAEEEARARKVTP